MAGIFYRNKNMRIPETYEEFELSLSESGPSELWPETLQALWWDAKGSWEKSHAIAQDIPSDTGSWIHAYLHRKEGDRWNAGYWYSRAKKAYPKMALSEELKDIVCSVLENRN